MSDSLNENIKLASEVAVQIAQDYSYCPYSHYRVGAVVFDNEDMFYGGANIENSSFGLTTCAERVAIYNWASASMRTEIRFLLYTALDSNGIAYSPCGACLQVMLEFMDPTAQVIYYNHKDNKYKFWSLKELIPHANAHILDK
jgi:cytidine deaminase